MVNVSRCRRLSNESLKATPLSSISGGIKTKQTVEVELAGNWPYLIQANRYDSPPRFVLFGGIGFSTVVERTLSTPIKSKTCGSVTFTISSSRTRSTRTHPEVIVLSNILPDPVNAYLSDLRFQIVDSINDRKIRSLEDVAAAFAQKADYYVVHFVGSARPAVLERSAVEQARDRIIGNYNVQKEQYVERRSDAMRALLAIGCLGIFQSVLALPNRRPKRPRLLRSRRDRWFESIRQTRLMTSFVPGAKKHLSAAAAWES